MLPIAAARGPFGPGPPAFFGFETRGGFALGGATASFPPSAAHSRRTRRLKTRFNGHSTACVCLEGFSVAPSLFTPPGGESASLTRLCLFTGVFSLDDSPSPSLAEFARSIDPDRRRLERRAVDGASASAAPAVPAAPFAAEMAASQDFSRPSSVSFRIASQRPHPCRSVPTSKPRSSRDDHHGAGDSQCVSTFFTSQRSVSHPPLSGASAAP
mmetsp:Transcript_8802/g.32940  ORF Transcript_8802/g.32940 Transcript_8802/m.32940 type:complete len:213 (-) Transcript_8802:743-1381(-)